MGRQAGIYRQAWQVQCGQCHVAPLKLLPSPLLPLLCCCCYDIVPCTQLMLAMSSVAPGLACSTTLQYFYVCPMSYLGGTQTPGKKAATNSISITASVLCEAQKQLDQP